MAGLQASILDILDLQSSYSFSNTPDMKRRGQLIRNDVPDLLLPLSEQLAREANIASYDVVIEGRDGTGRKSEIPWVRIGSRTRSPSATTGWYVVWLFCRDGSGVYLALAHGSTELRDGFLVARPDHVLNGLMEWSKQLLATELEEQHQFVGGIDLKSRTGLARAYQKSCAAAFFYPTVSVPDDGQLHEDLRIMIRLLGRIYEADRLGQTPISESPDVSDAKQAIDLVALPNPIAGGQGFGLSAEERRAVELCAMHRATAYLIDRGFSVVDVSATTSYDIDACRNGERLFVEVKGSTEHVDKILLSANEVSLHRRAYPGNGLIVVHSIVLERVVDTIVGTGGEIEASIPWKVDDDRLQAITYSYFLPSRDPEQKLD